MAGKTKEKLKYRKTANILLVLGLLILFFIVTPIRESSFIKNAGMAAAFVLFPASVYFNYKSRYKNAVNLPQKQSIAILIAFLLLAIGLAFFT